MSKLLELAEASTKQVEEQNLKFYWEVDGYKFNNRNLTYWYEKEYGCWATFVAQQFSSIKSNLKNTSIDLDYNYNLDYLKQLRSEYDHVRLLLSGGADSVTVFDIARNNNIHIDEIVCLTAGETNNTSNQEQVYNAIPLAKQYPEAYSELKIKNTSYDLMAQIYSDPYAFFTTCAGVMAPLAITRPFTSLTQEPIVPNSCYIKCTDKPQLMYYKNDWYAILLDAQIDGNIDIHNQLYFWLEGDNIKSYVKDSLLYRNYLKTNFDIKKHLQFFKLTPQDNANAAIGRSRPIDTTKLIPKIENNNKLDEKHVQRIAEVARDQQYQLMINYTNCLKKFFEIFPEAEGNIKEYNSKSKFAWLINIDTLEVFTQQELIPNGFEQ